MQYRDHTGHGEVELPYTGDDRKGDMGLSVGLQPDPVTNADEFFDPTTMTTHVVWSLIIY